MSDATENKQSPDMSRKLGLPDPPIARGDFSYVRGRKAFFFSGELVRGASAILAST